MKIGNLPSRRSKRRAIVQVLLLWQSAHPGEELDPDLIAPWAVANGLWPEEVPTPEDVCKGALRRHFRSEHIIDGSGRRPRKFQTALNDSGKPVTWPIFETPPEKMREVVMVKTNGALNDVKQVVTDLESYNEFNVWGSTIPQPSFDFDKTLRESRQPTTYPTKPPDDDGSDDDE